MKIGSFAIIPILFFGCIPTKQTTKSLTKEQRFIDAVKHEYDKTHDPKLDVIPSDRLQSALAYYQDKSELKGKTSPAFADIEWKERGPNNIGGRTRAILFLSATKVLAAGVTGGLWKTDDITASNPKWTQVDTFALNTVNVSCIAQDPNTANTLYLGTGEAFGSNQVGSGIYKSTDGGVNWSVLANTQPSVSDDFSYVAKILVASDGNVYAACKSSVYCNAGGLMRSVNSGANWGRVVGTYTGCGTCSCANDYVGADLEENGDGDLFYSSGTTGTNGHVFISDKGVHGTSVGNSGNWSDITPSGSWGRIEIGVTKQTSSNVIYLACQGVSSSNVTGIYYSNDNGTNWTSRSVPTICDQGNSSVFTRGQAWYDLVVVLDPSDNATAYFGGIDLLKTSNSGSSFSQITDWSGNWYCSGSAPPVIHADQHALVFNKYTTNAALSGNDGGLYYSTTMNSATPTWTSKNTGFNVTQYYAIATHPSNSNYVLGGTQDNGSHKLTSYGIGTGTDISGGDGGFCHINQNNDKYQLSSYVYNNYFFSSDYGTNFNYRSHSNAFTGRFINPTDFDDANNRLFSAGEADILELREVLGDTLKRSSYTLGFGGNELTALKVSPNNTNVLYVGDDGGNIYKITDRSTTPSKASWGGNVGTSGYISSIDVWKSTSGSDDSILVTISNYGVNSVYLTSNGTNSTPTWVDIDDNNTLRDMPIRWGIFSKESSTKLFIASDLGVLGTNNINGNSTVWTLINNQQLPYVRVDMLDYDADNNLVIGTYGRGIWETQQPCNLASALPTTAGTYTSAISHNDGSFTCFCTSSGQLLLALDTFGSGTVIPETGVSLQIAGSGNATISWSNSGGIITNPNGGAIIDRKWNVSPTTQPSSTVKVRYFFTAAEYAAIQTACANLTPSTTITNPNQLNFYKLSSAGVFADPHASSATGTILSHGSTPSTSVWKYSTSGSNHVGDFLVTSFSGGGGGGGANGGALPVELMSFDVKRIAKTEALLLWTTASEFNNSGFEIERSYDGAKFETIGWKAASDNPNQLNNYVFVDNKLNPVGSHVYYKFKQLDFDGKFEYSEVRSLKLTEPIAELLIYPNPAKSILNITGTDIEECTIFDVASKLVLKTADNSIDISNLKEGTYFVAIKSLRGVEYRKFIKI